MRRIKQAGALTLMMTAVFVLTGCNTVRGLGQDLQSIGNAGEEAIN
ncbi:entericidin A/B family lipoprotein [Croceicoccus esteveae]